MKVTPRPFRPDNRLGRGRPAAVPPPDAPHRSYERTHPTTSERIYTAEECRYLAAVEAYRAEFGRKFLTVVDHLNVARRLGYAAPTPIEDRPCSAD